MNFRFLGFLAAALFVVPTATIAATITFTDLPGRPLLDPFTFYTEANFAVTTTEGDWVKSNFSSVGDAPSIAGGEFDSTGVIQVTTTGLFTFQSVDLGDPDVIGTGVNYEIVGLLNGAPLFSMSSTSPIAAGVFTSIASESTAAIDALRIRLTSTTGDNYSYNVDNIVVTSAPVPLPAAAWLLLSGLAGLGFVGRRRTAK